MRQYSLSERMRNGGAKRPVDVCLARNGMEKDYMTLQMNYQEKYEQGIEHEKVETARRLIELGRFSIEEIADMTELTVEKVKEITELQSV